LAPRSRDLWAVGSHLSSGNLRLGRNYETSKEEGDLLSGATLIVSYEKVKSLKI
jgi:hypothetical protein